MVSPASSYLVDPRNSPVGGGGNYAEMVKRAYREILGREPDSGGLQNYINALKNGWKGIRTEADVKRDLMQSDEYRNRGQEESGGHHGGGGEGGGDGMIQGPSGGGANHRTVTEELTGGYLENIDDIAEKEFEVYSQYAPKYAEKQMGIIEDLYPGQSGLGELVANEISGRLQKQDYSVPDAVRDKYLEYAEGFASDKGLLRSGMLGRKEANDLTTLGIQMRQNDINTALDLYGGVPKVNPIQGTPGQGTASNIMGLGFTAGQNALDRSLQAAMANQDAQLRRYGIDTDAGLRELGIERSYASSIYGANQRYNPRGQSANPWVTAGAEVLANTGTDLLTNSISNSKWFNNLFGG